MKQNRKPAISGAQNFRDLGGYATADGRTVRWGSLFRSAVMSEIDGDGKQALRHMGIVSICDLRTNSERHHRPTTWHEDLPTELVSCDYESSAGKLSTLAQMESTDASVMRRRVIEAYRKFPEEQADNFRMLFRRLADGKVPLVFNCSAGKDRTGAAAALILAILKVPHEDIIADFLLTNEWADTLEQRMSELADFRQIFEQRPEVLRPMIMVERAYLDTFFDRLNAEYGGPEGYVTGRLGIDDQELGAIRISLTS